MKNPMRMQAATVVVLDAMTRLVQGHPLPTYRTKIVTGSAAVASRSRFDREQANQARTMA